MALGDFSFDPPTGHNNTSVFPDYPPRDQVRPLMQKLFDQIKTWLNGDVKTFVNGIDTALTLHKAESTAKHITESGNNANGRYIKFDDGTMICWHFKTDNIAISTANGSIFYGSISWSFPATFILAPNFTSITPTRASSVLWGSNTAGSASTTGVNFFILSGASLTANFVDSRMFAIGRWK